ncbi:MAG: CYTH domain-containing protein, partial [Oscillospiraceae bacterium]|nr:CYTH domain-containing protein [Oscillospiraceae bacterium]
MGTELEWKYAVPEPSLLDEILASPEVQSRIVEALRQYHMRSDFYDAPDLRFSRSRITLRRRLENESSVLCVKAPPAPGADPHLRGEWELAGDDLAAALPRLVALGAPEAL